MGVPNGDINPWADYIVASRFRYVQVSSWYDQLTDVPVFEPFQSPKQCSRRLDCCQAAQHLAMVARIGPSRGSWRWVFPAFAAAIEHVSVGGRHPMLAKQGMPEPHRGLICQRIRAGAPTGSSPLATEVRLPEAVLEGPP